MGGGHRSGEILRSGKPRHADGESGARGKRQTGAEANPGLSEQRSNGKWSGDGE
jgi:hypothetical protein